MAEVPELKEVRYQSCNEPLCIAVCPEENAVGRQGGDFPVFSQGKCTGCGKCAGACPYEAIVMVTAKDP